MPSQFFGDMPTESQLDIIFEAQLEFFAGAGMPKQNLEGASDGYGLTEQKLSEKPLISRNSYLNFKGPVVGTIVVNEDTRDLEIIVKK